MRQKTILTLSSFIIAGMMLLAVTPATFAENNSGTSTSSNLGIQGLINDVSNLQKSASASADRKQKSLTEIISRADSLITERTTQLNQTLTRIQNDKRLTDAEKTTLSGQIQDAINGLNTLKTKIDADTDAATAMADAKQIFTNYRVYEILEQKINILIMLNNTQTMIGNLQNLMPQLQNLVNTFGSQGKDVTQINALITDINSQITSLSTTITNDITTVEAININTQDPKTAFGQVRTDIQNTIKTGLQKIRTDIQQMRPLFKQLISPETSESPKPSTTSGTTQNSQ